MLELATGLLTEASEAGPRESLVISPGISSKKSIQENAASDIYFTPIDGPEPKFFSACDPVTSGDRCADAKIRSADLSSGSSSGDVGKLGIHRKKFRASRHFEPTLTSLCQSPDMGRYFRRNGRIARTMNGH